MKTMYMVAIAVILIIVNSLLVQSSCNGLNSVEAMSLDYYFTQNQLDNLVGKNIVIPLVNASYNSSDESANLDFVPDCSDLYNQMFGNECVIITWMVCEPNSWFCNVCSSCCESVNTILVCL